MATKAPTTRRTTRNTVAVPGPDEGVLAITTSEPKPDEEERRTLFTIDGEEFTVPKVIDERLTFLAMNYMRTEGALFTAMYLTELLLGKAQNTQLVRLYEQHRITKEQFEQVSGLINDLFLNRMKGDDTEAAGKDSDASQDG